MSSNIVLYSRFIWLNESIPLIRAETERNDIVRFSGIIPGELSPRPRLRLFLVLKQGLCWSADRVTVHPGT